MSKKEDASEPSVPAIELKEDAPNFPDSYKYHDHHSCTNETDVAGSEEKSVSQILDMDLRLFGPQQRSVRYHRFPLKLHIILAQDHFSDIITWMPHGRAWKVLNTGRLEREVLPLCFDSPNYNSFNRIVNAWCFRRISTGSDHGAYYHELFLRGMPQLHLSMRRLPRNGRKLRMLPEDEPNFYKMPPSDRPAEKKARSKVAKQQSSLANNSESPLASNLKMKLDKQLNLRSSTGNNSPTEQLYVAPPIGCANAANSHHRVGLSTPNMNYQLMSSPNLVPSRHPSASVESQQTLDRLLNAVTAAGRNSVMQSPVLNLPPLEQSLYRASLQPQLQWPPTARNMSLASAVSQASPDDLLQLQMRKLQIEELTKLLLKRR